jgi:pimeloyl-ACP methyl ester carboxylesterase
MGATTVRPVFVPGLGLDARSFARLRARIAGTVVHLPGMGLRETVPPLDDLAKHLAGELGEGPVLLVGHSQSCQVVVAVAQRDVRVAGVVLLGPTTDPRLRRPAVLALRWLRTAVREPVRSMPLVVAQWARTGPRAMVALWRAASPDRIDLRVATLRMPVVVVRGTRDALCPHDWAAGLAAAAPAGRLAEIPGAAHLTVQTHPAEVAEVIAGHWPSVRPRTSA